MITHQKSEKKNYFVLFWRILILRIVHTKFVKNFTPWEVLESEYLNSKKFKITEVCLRDKGTSIPREYSLTYNMFIAIIWIVSDYVYRKQTIYITKTETSIRVLRRI